MKKNPIVDSVAATSVGIVNGAALLDLNYEEIPGSSRYERCHDGLGQFVELQATGERAAFDDTELSSLVELGRAGVKDLLEVQSAVLKRDDRLLRYH